jgi:uncharacterized protein (TIGR03905 family)
MAVIKYQPKGVCAREIRLSLENGIITGVSFTSGCNGNLQGISRLVTGLAAETVIGKLTGIRCGRKNTSCPDQLARALEAALKEQREHYDSNPGFDNSSKRGDLPDAGEEECEAEKDHCRTQQ